MMKGMILLSLFSVLILLTPVYGHAQKCIVVKGGVWMLKGKMISTESFKITKYEITNTRYARFLNHKRIGKDGIYNGRQIINTNSPDLQVEYRDNAWVAKSGKKNFPMVMVTYYGALEYCQWAGAMLPDYEQWLYAAKGGSKSKNYSYAGSNSLEQVGWYKENSKGHSHKVGLKKANELGIHDMSGNAWEWCRNDSLKGDRDFCLHMGGSWYAGEQPSKVTAYYGNTPVHFSNSVGFRVIFPLKKK
jgi:formylglycine-generating enzyme required for sulfatase activity